MCDEILQKELIDKISNGNAILFTGAGFSLDLVSVSGKAPLRSSELSTAICKIAGIEPDDDLKYSSEYCIVYRHTEELINLLKDYFVIRSVSDATNIICSIKWRRFYTTNYDRGLEIGLTNNQKKYQTISIDAEVSKFIKAENPVIHLNGFIDNISEEELNKSFKLSNSSYVDSGLSDSSNWKYFFDQDLNKCSALVFIGYSLYDMDIEKLLYGKERLKEKTYFITEKKLSEKSRFRFEEYGKILNVEKSGFAEIIKNNSAVFTNIPTLTFRGFIPYPEENLYKKEKIRDNDIKSFLLYGKEQEILSASILLNENKDAYFAIYRHECIQKVIDMLKNNQHILVVSNYGNGKSCFLWQIATELFLQSKEVYFISDSNIDYFEELKRLSKSSTSIKYIIVDDCMAKGDFFKNYILLQPSNVYLICSDRTEVVNKWYDSIFPKDSFEFSVISIDDLSESEAESFIDIVDFIGQWGTHAGSSIEAKKRFLADGANHIQLSSSLLMLLKSPVITTKITELCRTFFNNEKYQDLVISVCYLRIIGIKTDFGLIYELSDSDLIYSSELRKNENFCQLFTLQDDYVEISEMFAKYLMTSGLVNCESILNRLYFIIKKFDKYSNRDYIQNAIFRSALRFHIVSGLLPESNRKSMMLDYYEQLKTILPWLKSDPNYWMQYAMAKMMWKSFDDAQKLLETAYSVANKKYEYDVSKIDNQQARLYLLFAQTQTAASDKFLYFQKADSILKHVKMDSYALHRIVDMLDFYDKCFTSIYHKNRKTLLASLSFYQKKIEDYNGDDKYRFGNLYITTEQKLRQILVENA